MTPEALRADRWATGPWCWCIGDVKLLPQPMALRGMQGLFPLPDAHERALRALVRDNIAGCLSLQQPFATAIATGPKRVENRPWRRMLLGPMWVGLHAGKAWYGGRDLAAGLVRVWKRPPEEHQRLPEYPLWAQCPELDDMPRGVLLGAMRIDAIVRYPARGTLL